MVRLEHLQSELEARRPLAFELVRISPTGSLRTAVTPNAAG